MIDYALKYDNAVLSGRIIAGFPIRRACEIDKRNRETKDPSYPFYFDKNIANEYIKLAKVLSDKPLCLFQLWFISNLSGWRFKSDHKLRRFSSSLFSCARKNAKSYLASLILTSALLKSELAGKRDIELYICASKLSQACLTLDTCKSMIQRLQPSSSLARNFKLNRTKIYSTKTGSYIQALSSNSNHLDGLNPSLVNIDEVHSFRSSKIIDVMNSAMGLQPNGHLLMTTTAGFNYQGPLRNDWETDIKALKDNKTKLRHFAAIYTNDTKKEIISNHKTWIKSNPLLSSSSVRKVMMPYLKTQLDNATLRNRPGPCLTKNFNKWSMINNDSFLDDLSQWTGNNIKPVDVKGRSNVVIGVDLSRVHDMTAISYTFPLNSGKYFTNTHAFIADRGGIDQKSKEDGLNYKALEAAGLVTICRKSYGLVDYRKVAQYIVDLINHNHWRDVVLAYDPWQAADLIQMLGSNDNINLIKVSQSVKNLTNVIRWLYRLTVSHKLLHENNILYNYAFNNLKATYSIHGDVYLNKARAVDKIDSVFALIDSLFVQKQLKQKSKTPTLSDQIKNNDIIF